MQFRCVFIPLYWRLWFKAATQEDSNLTSYKRTESTATYGTIPSGKNLKTGIRTDKGRPTAKQAGERGTGFTVNLGTGPTLQKEPKTQSSCLRSEGFEPQSPHLLTPAPERQTPKHEALKTNGACFHEPHRRWGSGKQLRKGSRPRTYRLRVQVEAADGGTPDSRGKGSLAFCLSRSLGLRGRRLA